MNPLASWRFLEMWQPVYEKYRLFFQWLKNRPDGSTDLNGDGVNGSLLPGTKRGSLGREINSVAKLNNLIRQYNTANAGKPLPRGGLAPYVLELPDSTRFGDSFISQDLQLSKIVSIKERLKVDRPTAFGSFSAVRPSIPTGTGLPRAAQFGLRFRF